MSSSGAKDLPQGLAMGYNREQRPDAALDVLAAGTAQARGGAQDSNGNRLQQTCRPVDQFEHVCVEKCPLTTRHTAKRSGDRKPDHGKTQRRKLRERVSRSHPHSGEPTGELKTSA